MTVDIVLIGVMSVGMVMVLKSTGRPWSRVIGLSAGGTLGAIVANLIARSVIDQYQPSGDVDVFASLAWGLASIVGFGIGLVLAVIVMLTWGRVKGGPQSTVLLLVTVLIAASCAPGPPHPVTGQAAPSKGAQHAVYLGYGYTPDRALFAWNRAGCSMGGARKPGLWGPPASPVIVGGCGAWYMNWSSDNCSAGMPDTGPTWNFIQPCQRHDFNYRNPKLLHARWLDASFRSENNRHAADLRFLDDMKASCDAMHDFYWLNLGYQTCYYVAHVAFNLVRVGGQNAYWSAY